MSPYVHRDSIGNPCQVPGRSTTIPSSLRPGPQGHHTGRRVSFAAAPVQEGSRSATTYSSPREQEAIRMQRAHSASAANAELHFSHSNSHRVPHPQPQHPAQRLSASGRQPDLSWHQQAPLPPPKCPDFLIIGLFALRLAKKLIRSLDRYPERDDDIAWINRFLHPYTRRDALAKISGERIEDYVTKYPAVVARFIKQPRYPIAFTELNPDRRITDRALTDQECIDIVDFADAAGEWGSTVKLPGMESDRIERLAERRRMAHF